MKAKEYAEMYIKEPSGDKLGEICQMFYTESVTLLNERKAFKNSAVFAVLDEMSTKWKAFAKRVNDKVAKEATIKENGFETIIKIHKPDIHLLWKSYKKTLILGGVNSYLHKNI